MKLNKLFDVNDFESTKETWLMKGDVFLYEGDDANKHCYLVKSGNLDVRLISGTGHETLLYQLKPRDLVGELAMFDANIRTATVVASTKTCLLEIENDEFNTKMKDHLFLEKLAYHFLSRYLKTHEVVCRLSQPNIGMKLCYYFKSLAENTGGDMENGAVLIHLPSHAVMAKLLSCQRETVTRELKKLTEVDILKSNGSGDFFLDMTNINLYLGDILER